MAKTVVMPKLGLTMKEGKLVKWYKQEGDKIESGDKLFSIETDKIRFVLKTWTSTFRHGSEILQGTQHNLQKSYL